MGDETPVERVRGAALEGSAGALAGLALGSGPVGVIAGAMAPTAVRGVSALAAMIARRWEDKASRALETAAAILDAGVDIFDERLPGHDERAELLARVIEAAARSTFEEKIPALGRVLAQGMSEDGDASEALILAAALAVLEAPHVVLLQHLAEHRHAPLEYLRPGIDSTLGWEAEHLSRAIPALGAC